MSRITIDWKGDELTADVEKAINTGINRATIWAARETERRSSTVYPGTVRKVSKKTGRVYWKGPGSPRGWYPGRRSGQLTASIAFEPAVNFRGSFGASVHYGDEVHRDRPFLELTIRRNARQIEAEFIKGAQSKLGADASGLFSVGIS